MRSNIIWRNVMMARFGLDAWTVMLDIDEFIALPPGKTLEDVVAEAAKGEERAVIGVMLDVYPDGIADLKTDAPFVLDQKWYFDGHKHMTVRKGGGVSVQYPGARARLFVQYGIRTLTARQKLRRLRKPNWYPKANLIHKQVLFRWSDADLFLSSHMTTAAATNAMLIPIYHFKFNPDLFRRTEAALKEKRYFDNSSEYGALARLLERMDAKDGAFRYRGSRQLGDIDALFDTGNAVMNL